MRMRMLISMLSLDAPLKIFIEIKRPLSVAGLGMVCIDSARLHMTQLLFGELNAHSSSENSMSCSPDASGMTCNRVTVSMPLGLVPE